MNIIKNLGIKIHNLFFPCNVIKIQALDRSWHDADQVMFHAMFQILVDFIELEKPFCDWENPIHGSKKRHLDIHNMLEYLLEFSKEQDQYSGSELVMFQKQLRIQQEQFDLYYWYKHIRPNYPDYFSEMRFEPFRLGSIQIDGNASGCITRTEYYELQAERELVEENMIQRLIAIRRTLWT